MDKEKFNRKISQAPKPLTKIRGGGWTISKKKTAPEMATLDKSQSTIFLRKILEDQKLEMVTVFEMATQNQIKLYAFDAKSGTWTEVPLEKIYSIYNHLNLYGTPLQIETSLGWYPILSLGITEKDSTRIVSKNKVPNRTPKPLSDKDKRYLSIINQVLNYSTNDRFYRKSGCIYYKELTNFILDKESPEKYSAYADWEHLPDKLLEFDTLQRRISKWEKSGLVGTKKRDTKK